jgi:hypothetical protein
MAYVQPQLRIFQEFEAALTAGLTPLYACIIGPHYGLHDGADCGSLGVYNRSASATYSWPDKAAGSIVEQDTASILVNSAVLRYYQGADFEVPAGTADGQNKITAPSLVVRTANGFDRTAVVFGTRDVAIGDRVTVSWSGGSSGSVSTRVAGFEADAVNQIDTATAASSNQTTVPAIAPAVDSQAIDEADLTVAAGGTYDGLAAGVVSDTYTVVVTKAGGTGVAEVSISSDSGTDDVANKVVAYASTEIGTRGLTCELTDAGIGSELVVGDTWVISAQQAFTAPVPVSGGSYSGPADSRYIVKIVTGGVIGTDNVVYNVSTTNGIDVQGNTIISAAGAVLVGNYGVTLTVANGNQYAGGDAWYIDVLESDEGAVRTLLLANKLVDGSAEAAVGDTLAVSLSLVEDNVLPKVYFSTTATSVTVLPAAKCETTATGSTTMLDLLSGDLCVEYRELLVGNTTSVNALTRASSVLTTLGPATTSNPLAKGVYSALLNSNGVPVYYIGVASDDLTGYAAALDVLSTNMEVYSLVPLNKTTAVRDLVEAHVTEQSSAENNNWRIMWANSNVSQDTPVYTKTTLGDDLEATVTDPDGGTNYVKVTCADGLFVTNGVQPGDVLRINYRPYAGETIYDTAIIDTVDTETELTLLSAMAEEFPVAVKIEVHRTLNLTQYATAIGQDAGAIKNRRVYYVWPDTISDGTETVSGIYLCSGLAGLRSGVAPHAPLTNVSISGFYSPSRTKMFNATQLNIMAGSGVWIVTQDLSGTVYTRHQVSTDNTDVNMREQTVTTNLDSIARQYREGYSDLIGRGNVSEEMLSIIQTRAHAIASSIKGLSYPAYLGPQMQDYEITQLAIDPVLRDRIRLTIQPVLPYPLNNLDITLLIA